MSDRGWNGVERRGEARRREDRGRVVRSRGPIILALETLTVLTGLVAIAALVFALTVFSSQLDAIQTAREESARDSCVILVRLIHISAQEAGKVRAGNRFIASVGLADCSRYAQQVRNGHLPEPGR